jgi:hypothetical protein
VIAALNLQGAGAWPGRLLSTAGNALDIAGEHLFVRLPLAQLVRAEMRFDAVHPRLGELVFRAERALAGTAEAMVNLSEGES